MTASCSTIAHSLVPSAICRPHPLQNLEVTSLCCRRAIVFRHKNALQPQPLYEFQISGPYGSRHAQPSVQAAPLLFCPLQHLQVTSFGSMSTHFFIPGAAHRPRPLQHPPMTTARSCRTCPVIPLTPMRSDPLQRGKLSTTGSSGASGFCQRVTLPSKPLDHFPLSDLCCLFHPLLGSPRAVLRLHSPLHKVQAIAQGRGMQSKAAAASQPDALSRLRHRPHSNPPVTADVPHHSSVRWIKCSYD
mmetsp:Transcript_31931/g.57184  ORF Transcript_31931/g.57184 Transcript_31931/m.57184 type:complete len:245 (-) Transcript_31931:323-1057(-)